MSLVRKSLSRVGIGAARIDAELDNDRVFPGDEMTGVVRILGGDIPQTVDYVGMGLMTQYRSKVDGNDIAVTHVLNEVTIAQALDVAADERREWPFTLPVPSYTPLTRNPTQVWIQTTLSVPGSLDPQDRDSVRIDPGERMTTVLNALEQLGFTLRQADCEHNPLPDHDVPFVQVFEFIPGGAYAGRLTELAVIMRLDSDGVQVWVEADRHTGGLADMLFGDCVSDEHFHPIYLGRPMLSQGHAVVASELGEAIDALVS